MLDHSLADLLAVVKHQGRVSAVQWSLGAELAAALGLELRAGYWSPSQPADYLEARAISAAAGATVDALEVVLAAGSTNSDLMERAQSQSIHQRLLIAECQVAGRGRRGNRWFSPFARNLAISYGFETRRGPNELGGLSLVVGLAVADALDQLGVSCQLKWPNDILLEGAKLGGILVELLHRPPVSKLVVGFGLNISLSEAERNRIDQQVATVEDAGLRLSRSELAGRLVARVSEFLAAHEAAGFAPFVPAFEAVHAYQGQQARLHRGDSYIDGRVLGVDATGQLRLESEGIERCFNAGEVSLRPHTAVRKSVHDL